MKIAFFTQNLGNYISGGRQYPWHMGHCLAIAGHEVIFVTNGEALFDREYKSFPNRKNVQIYTDNYYMTKPGNKQFLEKIIRCDLFMASPMESLNYGVTLAKMYKKKIIGLVYEPFNMVEEAQFNGIEIPRLTDQAISDFTKDIRKCDLILCNTELTRKLTAEWLQHTIGPTKYLYNSFNSFVADSVPIIPYDKRDNSVVFLSRTVAYKGVMDILEVFSQSRNKPNIDFISGFIDYNNIFQRNFFGKCNELGLKVTIHNRISELEKFKLLAKAKMLFFPSRFEGFGIPPAEAFYMKTPVVCYDLPVLQEIYGEYPHYVPFMDTFALRETVDTLLDDPNMLFRGLDEAKQHVTKFARIEEFTKNIDEIICRVMQQKPTYVPKPPNIQEIVKIKEEVKEKEKYEDIYYLESNQFDKIDLEKIKSKYVILYNTGVRLSKHINEETLIRMEESDYEILTFNYRKNGKEKKHLGFHIDATLIAPGYLGGCVAIRLETLKKYWSQLGEYWELDLSLKALNAKWFHTGRLCFEVDIPFEYSAAKVERMYAKHLKDCNLDFTIVNNEDSKHFTVINNKYEQDKVLIVIPARTCEHLPKLLPTIHYRNSDIVICVHEPDGNFDQKIFDLANKMQIKTMAFTGKFNFSKMNNEAIAKHGTKDHKYYVLCNDDIIMHPMCMYRLIRGFNYRYKDVGVVGTKLVYPKLENEDYVLKNDWDTEDRKLQHGGVVLLSDKRCTHFRHRQIANKICVNHFKLYPAVTFGLVAIDADCYESTKLNEEYSNDLNDIDFCIRASKKGWNILYNPTAIAFHLETVTRQKFKQTDDFPSRAKFKKDHGDLMKKQMSISELFKIQNGLL